MCSKMIRAVAVFACLFCTLSAFTYAAEEMTKKERLENTLYLQSNNYASAKDGVLTVIDADDKSVTPKIHDGVFYVPLRFVLESFGVEVGWDDSAKTVTASGGGKVILVSVNEDTASLGEVSVKLDYDCYIDNSRTYLALEDVSKIIKCNTFCYSCNPCCQCCPKFSTFFARSCFVYILYAMVQNEVCDFMAKDGDKFIFCM